jgi:hypothetical protein
LSVLFCFRLALGPFVPKPGFVCMVSSLPWHVLCLEVVYYILAIQNKIK